MLDFTSILTLLKLLIIYYYDFEKNTKSFLICVVRAGAELINFLATYQLLNNQLTIFFREYLIEILTFEIGDYSYGSELIIYY